MRIVAVAITALALVLQLGACGATGGSATGDTTESIDAPVPAYTGKWTDLERKAGPHADELLVPEGPSPEEVVIHDVKKGTGAPIEPGDTFAARYISVDYETGKTLEVNWKPQPWRLKWKIGELVDGWEPGLKGVRAGGLRELIVPSSLAYEHGPMVYLVEVAYIERH